MKALGRRPALVALVSVFIGVAIVLGKIVVGLLTGSLGILSEAAHSVMDLIASTFALVAVSAARKPADSEHPYGHGRAENLAAFGMGVLLVVTAAGIAYEALRRVIIGGEAVNPAGYAFVLLIATLVIESGRAVVLRRVARIADSEALRADATDRLADVFAIQSEIAEAIAAQLRAQLSPAEKAHVEQRPTADLAAYDLYLQAKALQIRC